MSSTYDNARHQVRQLLSVGDALGFDFNVTTDMINISTGTINFLLSSIDIINNHSTSDLYVHVHSDGSFDQHLTLNACSNYNDGSSIGNNKFYSAVFGMAVTHDGAGVMYVVTQDRPSNEYIKAIDAEVDIENTVNFFPSDDLVSLVYIPIIRVVIRRSGGVNTIQTLSNGLLFDDLRGTVTKTSSSPPPSGITVHSDLSNLDFASAGHTGNLDMGDNDITANSLNGSWNGSVNYNTSTEISGAYVPYTGADDNINFGANNFSVDTNVLYVDKNNNRVGIGIISPYSGLHYQGDIFYLTPNAGTESNDNITIKNYATGNGAPNIILRTADIDGAYGIGVGTLSLVGGSKTTHYGGIGGGGGEISLQGGQGRDASNNPSGYAPVLLQANGGNVGIGTDSPGRLFEVFGSASVFRFRDSGPTGSATTAFIEFGGTDGGSWNRTGYIGDGSSANKDLLLVAEAGDLRLGDSSSNSVLTLSGGVAIFSGDITANSFNGSWNGSEALVRGKPDNGSDAKFKDLFLTDAASGFDFKFKVLSALQDEVSILTFDTSNGARTLTITADATVNQDTRTSSSPTFIHPSLTKLTVDEQVGFGTAAGTDVWEVLNMEFTRANNFGGWYIENLAADGISRFSVGMNHITGTKGVLFQYDNEDGRALVLNRKATIGTMELTTTGGGVKVLNDGNVQIADAYSNDIGTERDLLINASGDLGYDSSSIVFKENVKDMTNEMSSKIHQLRPVTYDKISGKKNQIGLIAEEVYELYPEFISYKREEIWGECCLAPDDCYECVTEYRLARDNITGELIPETISYKKLVIPLIQEVQNLKEEKCDDRLTIIENCIANSKDFIELKACI
ncbi:hypothetical protein LCGC14_0515000 [marine sediment metagenome]|uniref:Peptidase S74 domain-containing protein n=1 Tax=marine sediment metagenome TaxID=412755 RepID=A0A0F9S4W9_9ZZZZ